MTVKELTIDYYREKDILYLRALPLPKYRVREPFQDFLVYVGADGDVVGFEILDFSSIVFYLEAPELQSYLALRFAAPSVALVDAPLDEIIWQVYVQIITEEDCYVPIKKESLYPLVQLARRQKRPVADLASDVLRAWAEQYQYA